MLPLKIEILNENEKIEQVCREYWDCNDKGEFRLTVAQIAREHGLKSSDVSTIAYDGCNAYSEDYVCTRCGDAFVFSNRTDYLQAFRHPTRAGKCPDCQAEEIALTKARQDAELKKRLDAIREHYALSARLEPDLEALNLEDAVYLLSFDRSMSTEDLTIYHSLNNATFRLAPTEDFRIEILKHLFDHKEKLIRVHPSSPVDAFLFEDEEPNRFYISKVQWALATGKNLEETRRFIIKVQNALENPDLRPLVWNEQILQLWRKVAFSECMEYLQKVLTEHQFPFNPGDKTHLVINHLLESRSVSEIYHFISIAVRNAAAFYQRGHVTRPHAANTVIGNMQSYSERARAEGWDRKRYRRDFNCPQTIVSKVTFDLALKIGDAGFDDVPHAITTKKFNSIDEEFEANE